ncbi:uncharacterized protein LOC144604451 [Rhinoraja longicauda]
MNSAFSVNLRPCSEQDYSAVLHAIIDRRPWVNPRGIAVAIPSSRGFTVAAAEASPLLTPHFTPLWCRRGSQLRAPSARSRVLPARPRPGPDTGFYAAIREASRLRHRDKGLRPCSQSTAAARRNASEEAADADLHRR